MWLHEEFHRAVMGNRGIGSYNDVYKWDFFSDVAAVSHVRDEDLIRLKAEHPADQVRLGVAGMESELLLVRELEKNRFFHSPRGALWLQPEDQLFRSRAGEAGGLLALHVRYPTSRRLGAFAELEGKTDGWVAGNVYLDANVSGRVGASLRLD